MPRISVERKRRDPRPRRSQTLLLADSQLLDDRFVPLCVVLLQIVQQATALAHHHKQSTAGSMVLLVRTEVIRQLGDPLTQQSDLNFRATGIRGVGLVSLDYVRFLFSC
jgi:hypothetical protein